MVAAILGSPLAYATLDLANAVRERLPNGLTLIVLEDRNFPVASVQMLYRVGARDEAVGYTGLAHFLEHMAFRSSAAFPGTGLVSSIYAVGGEWHGYTWLDQTTYFATVPRDELDLLLRIEAERMSRLTLSPDDVEAERGAVLAEMHMYENYPSSMLVDAVMFAVFQGHPYRNNTIGFESDIENLGHADVVNFYRRHYHPANAVLAVVGDVDTAAVRSRVLELFGDVPTSDATPLPHTVEPPQQGERHVMLSGPVDAPRFLIAYRAPAAAAPDFAAFLVLQELLGGSSGVSFLQNDWGTPVRPESVLHGAAESLTTWFPPGAQDYVFTIGGSASPAADMTAVEVAVESRVATLRDRSVSAERLDTAIAAVLDQLVYDVTTTEDAAHQLAYFEGLHAYDVLLTLPSRVRAVGPDDVRAAALRYLQPEARTIGWYVPGERVRPSTRPYASRDVPPIAAANPVDEEPAGTARTERLSQGLPVVVQRSDLSPAVFVQVQLPPRAVIASDALSIDPDTGLPVLTGEARPDGLATLLADLRRELSRPPVAPDAEASVDPETRLAQVFARLMSTGDAPVPPAPLAVIVTGDVDEDAALAILERCFGDVEPAEPGPAVAGAFRGDDVIERIGTPLAQAQLGYLVPAPLPADADAIRLLLYILSHDYGGRLGDSAISEKGLAYYIDARYRSDGRSGWISLATGVDPGKLDSFADVFAGELARLERDPPTESEIAEARSHFVGRAQSASQSNAELAARIGRQLAWYGRPLSAEEQLARWRAVPRTDVIAAIPGFVSGARIVVRE